MIVIWRQTMRKLLRPEKPGVHEHLQFQCVLSHTLATCVAEKVWLSGATRMKEEGRRLCGIAVREGA
eukprot:167128-Chlamydomonas_euryale.AAC.15